MWNFFSSCFKPSFPELLRGLGRKNEESKSTYEDAGSYTSGYWHQTREEESSALSPYSLQGVVQGSLTNDPLLYRGGGADSPYPLVTREEGRTRRRKMMDKVKSSFVLSGGVPVASARTDEPVLSKRGKRKRDEGELYIWSDLKREGGERIYRKPIKSRPKQKERVSGLVNLQT